MLRMTDTSVSDMPRDSVAVETPRDSNLSGAIGE